MHRRIRTFIRSQQNYEIKCQNLSFLVHLNICGSKVGDVICKKLLDNLYLGGCHITLKALELSDCNISLSNNTMDVLTKFSQLR